MYCGKAHQAPPVAIVFETVISHSKAYKLMYKCVIDVHLLVCTQVHVHELITLITPIEQQLSSLQTCLGLYEQIHYLIIHA
jgi:hypothetical protein